MNRLFILRDGRKGRPVRDENDNVLFFDNKMAAKAVRKEGQVVSLGPDHRLSKGDVK